MPISAARKAVNTAANIQKVVYTVPAEMSDMAAVQGMMSWIIQG